MSATAKTVKEILCVLSNNELIQLIHDYDLLELYGYIGQCLLRTKVEEIWDNDQLLYFRLHATGIVLQAQRELLSRHEIV